MPHRKVDSSSTFVKFNFPLSFRKVLDLSFHAEKSRSNGFLEMRIFDQSLTEPSLELFGVDVTVYLRILVIADSAQTNPYNLDRQMSLLYILPVSVVLSDYNFLVFYWDRYQSALASHVANASCHILVQRNTRFGTFPLKTISRGLVNDVITSAFIKIIYIVYVPLNMFKS